MGRYVIVSSEVHVGKGLWVQSLFKRHFIPYSVPSTSRTGDHAEAAQNELDNSKEGTKPSLQERFPSETVQLFPLGLGKPVHSCATALGEDIPCACPAKGYRIHLIKQLPVPRQHVNRTRQAVFKGGAGGGCTTS